MSSLKSREKQLLDVAHRDRDPPIAWADAFNAYMPVHAKKSPSEHSLLGCCQNVDRKRLPKPHDVQSSISSTSTAWRVETHFAFLFERVLHNFAVLHNEGTSTSQTRRLRLNWHRPIRTAGN